MPRGRDKGHRTRSESQHEQTSDWHTQSLSEITSPSSPSSSARFMMMIFQVKPEEASLAAFNGILDFRIIRIREK